ncbi:MAG: protein kinase [Rhodocyclaceae bacterium]
MERIGKYDILHLIGEGSTSDVFLAYDPFRQRQVAIKRIFNELLRDPVRGTAYRQQLETEAALAGKLKHPHIAETFDVVLSEQESYFVMEYVEGGTLEAFCTPDRLLPYEQLIEILFKCTRALDYAFMHGVTHRDIKPANIMLASPEGSDVKVSDFGAALFKDADKTMVVGLGSPAYMSPEQVREQPLTHQTDIYSLGIMMFQLLTGQLPFSGSNPMSLAYMISHTETPVPSSIRPGIPSELDRIVARATHKSLAARYTSWLEFSHDLAQASRTLRLVATRPKASETQRYQILREMPFLEHFTDVEIWETLRMSDWREVSAGSLVMRRGEPGRYFALLAAGQACINLDSQRLHTLSPGECFGEMALFAGMQGTRSADVIADSDCTVIEIREEALERASPDCRNHFYRAFLSTMARRLMLTSARAVHP